MAPLIYAPALSRLMLAVSRSARPSPETSPAAIQTGPAEEAPPPGTAAPGLNDPAPVLVSIEILLNIQLATAISRSPSSSKSAAVTASPPGTARLDIENDPLPSLSRIQTSREALQPTAMSGLPSPLKSATTEPPANRPMLVLEIEPKLPPGWPGSSETELCRADWLTTAMSSRPSPVKSARLTAPGLLPAAYEALKTRVPAPSLRKTLTWLRNSQLTTTSGQPSPLTSPAARYLQPPSVVETVWRSEKSPVPSLNSTAKETPCDPATATSTKPSPSKSATSAFHDPSAAR